jgi:heme-degrading monooxygenase HmoA
MVSYFRLRGARVLPAFALNTLRIERQLARSEGIVGHSGGARVLSLEFWSVSVWEDEHALQRFVHARPHIEIMRAMRPAVVHSEFVRWPVAGAEVPSDPKEAEQRLHRALTADDSASSWRESMGPSS